MNFDSMNETDVREIIVRPFLSRLGYAHGTQANIRTEVTLKYDKAFLGRKNAAKDPPLAGRADYICDAISYGRWTVEVKAPQHEITQDDVEQAHTYTAHPEIAASYFMLTNGREFRLYAASRLDAPLLAWRHDEIDQHLPALFNILGYEGLKRHSQRITPDVNKPLGGGLNSVCKIVGGVLTYGPHTSNHPLFQGDVMNGVNTPVVGREVKRTPEGLILGHVEISSAFSYWAELNRLSGIDGYEFATADEFISDDINAPSIFQNVVEASMPVGTVVRAFPGMPEFRLPFGFEMKAYTQAVGFLDGQQFKGTFDISYEYTLVNIRNSGIPQLDMMLRASPRVAQMSGGGVFDLRVQ